MKIAVDFDGTIVQHRYPAIGKAIPYAIDVLINLQKEGHKIMLWTVREGKLLDEAVEYCRERGLVFFSVNSEYPDAAWSGSGVSRKIRADLYIDDHNFGGIPEWSEIYNRISSNSGKSNHPVQGQGKHGKCSPLRSLVLRCRKAREKFKR